MHHSKFHSIPLELNIKQIFFNKFRIGLEGFLQGPYTDFFSDFRPVYVNPGFNRTLPVFTMNYALFFKNISFYNELYTVRLGVILRPF